MDITVSTETVVAGMYGDGYWADSFDCATISIDGCPVAFLPVNTFAQAVTEKIKHIVIDALIKEIGE